MNKKTILHSEHLKLNAKMVDFAGWDMPIHYGSQLEEHRKVRADTGIFDVSHMAAVDITGENAKQYLQILLANDVDKLTVSGKALYSCMLNNRGGVVDDLIVYYFNPHFYRIVVNAGTREKDLAWMQQHVEGFSVKINERTDLSILAIQGPNARLKINELLSDKQKHAIAELTSFQGAMINEWLIARTGYTGEDGYEIILPSSNAVQFWQQCMHAGIQPCGLGARDTLRLEAGLNLYGQDMDESTSPLISNLAWTIAFEPQQRNFIGRAALEVEKQQGIKQRLVGLILQERGVLRSHCAVEIEGKGIGETTSGSFSPVLEKAIALARVPVGDDKVCRVAIRDKWLQALIVKPPFVRKKV